MDRGTAGEPRGTKPVAKSTLTMKMLQKEIEELQKQCASILEQMGYQAKAGAEEDQAIRREFKEYVPTSHDHPDLARAVHTHEGYLTVEKHDFQHLFKAVPAEGKPASGVRPGLLRRIIDWLK